MKFFRTAILCLSIGLSSCIHSDESCIPHNNLSLRFSFTSSAGNEAFVQQVETTNLFIFDEQGYFVRQHTIPTSALDANQSTLLTLNPGTYRIVCWGNVLQQTGVDPLTSSTLIESAFIYNTTLQGSHATNSDPLYYATNQPTDYPVSAYFTMPPTGTVAQTLHFASAHIKLQVFIEGFTDLDGAGNNLLPIIEVEALETKGDFNMRPFGDKYNYVQSSALQTIQGKGLATAYFNLPTFKNNNSLKLHIKRASTGATVTTVILADYMTANRLTVEDVAEPIIPIHLLYTDTQDVGVTITLPPWGDTAVIPEL